MSRVLCVEDHQDSCEMMAHLLHQADARLNVETAASGLEAKAKITAQPYDAYVLDLKLPDVDGPALCVWIRDRDGDAPIIFYTASADVTARQSAEACGKIEFLVKPNDLERLSNVVLRSLGHEPNAG